jgi:DNA-binding NarL/FixJ family response regulator
MLVGTRLLVELLARLLAHDARLSIAASQPAAAFRPEQVLAARPDVLMLGGMATPEAAAETVREVRRLLPIVKTVVVTPVLDEALLAACVTAGAVGCLSERCSPAELADALACAHAGQVLYPAERLVRLLMAPPAERPASPLAPRELAVLRVLATGASTEEVAEQLGIAVLTVRTHLRNAMAKLHAHSKLEAILLAVKADLITLEG